MDLDPGLTRITNCMNLLCMGVYNINFLSCQVFSVVARDNNNEFKSVLQGAFGDIFPSLIFSFLLLAWVFASACGKGTRFHIV